MFHSLEFISAITRLIKIQSPGSLSVITSAHAPERKRFIKLHILRTMLISPPSVLQCNPPSVLQLERNRIEMVLRPYKNSNNLFLNYKVYLPNSIISITNL